MRKRRGPVLIATLLSAALVACGNGGATGGAGAAEGEPVTLRIATGLSDQHGWWAGSVVPWMDRVTELTDGQVEFQPFVGGELVSVPGEIEAIQNGTVDLALILPIYQPDQFPMAEVTMLPISQSDVMSASRAYRSLLESEEQLSNGQTYYESEFGSRDIKAFPLSTTQEYSISTTGARLDSVQAVRGMSLRTPSRIHQMYAEKTGINSVTIPAVEMFDALSRGAFNGSFYSIADWSGYGFQDLFEYTLTDINFGHFNGQIGMMQATWDGLPENVQEAMEQAHDDIFEDGAQEWADRAQEMIEYNEGRGGVFQSFDELPQDVQQHLTAGVEDTWNDYIALLDGQGLPGREVTMLWRDLLVEEGGAVPDSIAAMQ
jgi:TRAP-type C4-dicarboxylate transport system substrate-binding protein